MYLHIAGNISQREQAIESIFSQIGLIDLTENTVHMTSPETGLGLGS